MLNSSHAKYIDLHLHVDASQSRKGIKKMSCQRSLLLLSTLLIATLVVSAHDTWLIPRTVHVQPGSKTQLMLTSGMFFPRLETSIKPDRIDVARCRLNGNNQEIASLSSAAKALVLTTALNVAGIASCWVELKPRQLELTPKLVEEYFAEIEADPEIRQEWRNMREPKRWREVYVKHAKTFVSVGETHDDSWREPVGMALELVPEKDPTALQKGDDLPVRVLRNGTPMSGFKIGFVYEGEATGAFRSTDAEGRAVFNLGRAGRYLLRGTDLRRSAKPDLEWESDFTTLTVQAAPAKAIKKR